MTRLFYSFEDSGRYARNLFALRDLPWDDLIVDDICAAIASVARVPSSLIRIYLPDERELTDRLLECEGYASLFQLVTARNPLIVAFDEEQRRSAGEVDLDSDSDSDSSSSNQEEVTSLDDGEDGESGVTSFDSGLDAWSTLGTAFSPPRDHDLDRKLIDLAMFRPLFRNEHYRHALCLVYEYLTTSPSETSLLRDLLVQSQSRSELIVNTIAGYVQIGKTRVGAAAAYVLCYMCSLVPCIFVRSQGGADSMDSFNKAIVGIADEVINFLRAKIQEGSVRIPLHELLFFRPKVMETRDFVDADSANIRFGNRSTGMIIVGRQNSSTMERLFGQTQRKKKTPINRKSLAELIRDNCLMNYGNNMRRYALIFDEDDAAQGSAGRDVTKTDLANYRNMMPIRKLVIRLVFGPRAKRLEAGEALDDDVRDDDADDPDDRENEAECEAQNESEQDVSYQHLITNETVRATAACIIQMSASWLTNEIFASEKYRQKTRVLQVPVPANYVGIWSKPHDRAVVIKTIPASRKTPRKPKEPKEPTRRRNQSNAQYRASWRIYEKKCDQYEQDVLARSSYDKCRPWHKHEDGLRMMFSHVLETFDNPVISHVSIHVNTQATTTNENQRTLAEKIITEFGSQVPMVTFAYNQDAATLQLLLSKHSKWSENAGHDVSSAYLADLLTGQSGSDAILEPEEETLSSVTDDDDDDDDHFLVSLQCSSRRIQRVYSIIYELFEALCTKPFLVCITGALGGRAFTMKTTDHRYPLTDQFFDVTRTHMERLLQYTGRICSKDDCIYLERRLWISGTWKEALLQTIDIYAEVASLYKRHPDSELSELLEKISERQYPALFRYLQNNSSLEISRPKVIRPVKRKYTSIAQAASKVNLLETQKEVVYATLKSFRDKSATSVAITKYLEQNGRAKSYRTDDDYTDLFIRKTDFVFKIGPRSRGAHEDLSRRVQKALQQLKNNKRIHAHQSGTHSVFTYRVGSEEACDSCRTI